MAEVSPPSQEPLKPQRLQSLDAYRGLIMISLAFVGFGLAKTAAGHLENDPSSRFWQTVQYQFSHAQWVGCSYWDMIQPSFMFMVGVSMAYSYAKRQRLGDSYWRMFAHAAVRAVVLILLSIFLMSKSKDRTHWEFMNVLAQIGLGYIFLFLLWNRPVWLQGLGAIVILAGTWWAYESYPNPGIDLTTGAPEVGVSKEWAEEHLQGIRAAWHKNANVGHAIDRKVLNLFPRSEPFEFNSGGYQTINFIPAIATMLFGLMCGELLRGSSSSRWKLLILIASGIVGLIAGQALHLTGVCPLVKRIWTPSWALFSTGWCCLTLAGMYGVIDVTGFRHWSFPLRVVGMNSIAIYCMSMSLKPWTARQLETHLENRIFTLYGTIDPTFSPTIEATLVGTDVLAGSVYYLYRNKISSEFDLDRISPPGNSVLFKPEYHSAQPDRLQVDAFYLPDSLLMAPGEGSCELTLFRSFSMLTDHALLPFAPAERRQQLAKLFAIALLSFAPAKPTPRSFSKHSRNLARARSMKAGGRSRRLAMMAGSAVPASTGTKWSIR